LPPISASPEYPPSIIFAAVRPLFRNSTGRNRNRRAWFDPTLGPLHAGLPRVALLRGGVGVGRLTWRSREKV
jgi:hypothetical protein